MNDFSRYSRIELAKESFKFSSGHFTIFSATERENIHGHNFTVRLAFDAVIAENGMIFDYKLAKDFLQDLCDSLDEYFLIPQYSSYLQITQDGAYVILGFNGEKIPFLKRDVKIIPVTNVTVEELSAYLLRRFVAEFVQARNQPIHGAEVQISSGPGQSATAAWSGK